MRRRPPGQLDLFGHEPAPKTPPRPRRKRREEQRPMFGQGALLQGVERHVTEAREAQGPLFAQLEAPRHGQPSDRQRLLPTAGEDDEPT